MSSMPCRCRQPTDAELLGRQRLGHQRVVVDRHGVPAAPAARATGRRWCRARPGRPARCARSAVRTTSAVAVARRGRRPRVSSWIRTPSARRRRPAPRPAGPGRPGRCRRGPEPGEVGRRVHLGADRVPVEVLALRVRLGRPRAATSTWCGSVATDSAPVQLEVAVDAVAADRRLDRGRGSAGRAARACRSRRGTAARRCRGRASATPSRSRRCGPDAAQPIRLRLEQHHLAAGVALLGQQGGPQPRVAAADDDEVGRGVGGQGRHAARGAAASRARQRWARRRPAPGAGVSSVLTVGRHRW